MGDESCTDVGATLLTGFCNTFTLALNRSHLNLHLTAPKVLLTAWDKVVVLSDV